nr:hypothetical protein DM860_005947 [Ipomoea batatas]
MLAPMCFRNLTGENSDDDDSCETLFVLLSREQIGIAHHRHLPHGGNHRVPTHHAQAASVILAFHERKVENHQQPYLVECRRGVYPLCPSHQLGGDDAERRRLGREGVAMFMRLELGNYLLI